MNLENELKEIKNQLNRLETLLSKVNLQNRDILSINEAAEFCGLKVSYMYKLCSFRKIPHYKNSGKMLRFKKVELTEWLLRNKVKTDIDYELESNSYILRSKI